MKMQIYALMERINKIGLAVLLVIAAFAAAAGIAAGGQKPVQLELGTNFGWPTFSTNSTDFLPGASTYDYTDPAFVDYDGDGDYDAIVGLHTTGNDGLVGLWRNDNGTMVLQSSNVYNPGSYYITVAPVDFDYDGDYDFFVGRLDGLVEYIRNNGDAQSPSFGLVKTVFDIGYGDSSDYAAPALADTDNDGDYDMYIGQNDGDYDIYYFENVASETSMDFDYASKEWLYDIVSDSSCSLVDIDADNDYDAICTNSGGASYWFENEGNSTEQMWSDLRSNFISSIGQMADFSFADMDADNDLDLVVGKNDGLVAYYKNVGTNESYNFQLEMSDIGIGDIGTRVAPTMGDIDGDGDYDLYVGESGNNRVYFYRNIGNATDLNFSTLLTGTPISSPGTYPNPFFVDLNNDTLLDLVVGRNEGYLYYYRNDGNSTDANWTAAGNLLTIGTVSAPGFADIDNDGDYDAVAGMSSGYCRIYYNDGNSTNPSISGRMYGWEYVEAGQEATPELVDFDYDGDLDLFISRKDGRIYYYENTPVNGEDDFNLSYELFDIDYIDASTSGYPSQDGADYAGATFADVDNDGDYDMYVGDNTYQIKWFENLYKQGRSVNWTYVTSAYVTGVGSTYAKPTALDFDQDGDYDLIIGRLDGNVYYYKNEGNATNASFAAPVFWVNAGSNYAAASAADLDGDGDYDLGVGATTDDIIFWTNTGNTTDPVWTRNTSIDLTSTCTSCQYAHPHFRDMDGDNVTDMLAAVYYSQHAYIRYFRNTGNQQQAQWGTGTTLLSANIPFYPSTAASMAYEDFNNDSVADLIMGSFVGIIGYYANLGTNSSPSFKFVTGNKGWKGEGGYSGWYWMYDANDVVDDYISVTAADMDGDGDNDIITGDKDSNIRYYRNDGIFTDNRSAALYPVFTDTSSSVLPANGKVFGSDNAQYPKPKLIDFDEDGVLELVIGVYWSPSPQYGRVAYVENTGTKENAVWVSSHVEMHRSYPSDFADFNYPQPAVCDADGDGDYDLAVGYDSGGTRYEYNSGTNQNPVWNKIYAGDNDDTWMDDLGTFSRLAAYDMDGDGDCDYWACFSDIGYCILLKNDGVFQSAADRAAHSTWINRGIAIDTTANEDLNTPEFADWDGDGDYDIALGYHYTYGRVVLYENTGTMESPTWVSRGNFFGTGSSTYGYVRPGFGDFDNDGDLDMMVGTSDGSVYYAQNDGNYANNSVVTLLTSSKAAISGASVIYSNSTGTICSGTSDSKGHFPCNIAAGTEDITVGVSGATDAATARVKLLSPTSIGHTAAELGTKSDNFRIPVKKIEMNVFTPDDNLPDDSMKVRIGDSYSIMFNGKVNDSGFLDAYLPERYLTYVGEPYSQNRITYDIEFFPDVNYGSELLLEGIYAPNKINLSSSDDTKKLFKFPSAELMATDSQYRAYVIYPAVTAQKNYNMTDSIPANLTFVGNVSVYYRGSKVCEIVPSGKNYSFDYTTAGCEELAIPVSAEGDWLKVEYTVSTPAQAYFESEGWTRQNFTSAPAILKLLS